VAAGPGRPGAPKTSLPDHVADQKTFLETRLKPRLDRAAACHGQNVAKASPPEPGKKRADLAASFQEAVVDAVALKCRQALRKTGLTRLAVGGGVSANNRLRQRLADVCDKEGAELIIPPLNLCTDNAAMAALAVEKWQAGEFAPPDLDAEPNYL
jgi:N6-L-threonylcarbamoyladenine synthase